MAVFKKYQHVERLGTPEVEGILDGECFIFPKLDGTNGSVWLDDNGVVQAGSRKRELSAANDNAGFREWVVNDDRFTRLFAEYPSWRLFGEWLVPHTLKTYREDAWRQFYVFDVCEDSDIRGRYMRYYDYIYVLNNYGIDCVPFLFEAIRPSIAHLERILEANTYLIEEEKGSGEGIVIKNYDFCNKYGRITWAKLVRDVFKAAHLPPKTQGAKELPEIERSIADEFVTEALVDKTIAKIGVIANGFTSKMIPQLLSFVYYELVREEAWNFVKRYKNPVIDFKKLRGRCIDKIKELKPEMF